MVGPTIMTLLTRFIHRLDMNLIVASGTFSWKLFNYILIYGNIAITMEGGICDEKYYYYQKSLGL